MPYVRKTYTRSYKKGYQPKRSFKKGKKRFSKKKFYKKNNLNSLSIRPMVYARELYVKMKWTKLENLSAATTSSVRRVYLGNSAAPYIEAQTGYALGSFLSPDPAITAGELYPGGLVEYGSFYDKYTILGSSINIVAHVIPTSTNIVLRAVFIPITPSPDSGTDGIDNMINQLDGYDFNKLMAYPQAQYRQVISAASGHAYFAFKSFRKTKNMFMIKDMKDEQDKFNEDMPTTAAASGRRPGPTNLWGFYFRIFNDTATTHVVATTTTMKQYYRLNQRRYVQAVDAT